MKIQVKEKIRKHRKLKDVQDYVKMYRINVDGAQRKSQTVLHLLNAMVYPT